MRGWIARWWARRKMRWTEKRNVQELLLYSIDDLRRLYQSITGDNIQLRDGLLRRIEIVAEIRSRIFWARIGYGLLLIVTVAGTFAAIIAAWEGRKTF